MSVFARQLEASNKQKEFEMQLRLKELEIQDKKLEIERLKLEKVRLAAQKKYSKPERLKAVHSKKREHSKKHHWSDEELARNLHNLLLKNLKENPGESFSILQIGQSLKQNEEYHVLNENLQRFRKKHNLNLTNVFKKLLEDSAAIEVFEIDPNNGKPQYGISLKTDYKSKKSNQRKKISFDQDYADFIEEFIRTQMGEEKRITMISFGAKLNQFPKIKKNLNEFQKENKIKMTQAIKELLKNSEDFEIVEYSGANSTPQFAICKKDEKSSNEEDNAEEADGNTSADEAGSKAGTSSASD